MDFVCPHTCSYRTNSGYCGRTGGWESCQYRQLHQPNTVVGYVPPLKRTNADRIRAMSDEELAELFEMIPHSGNPPTYTIDGFCIDDGLRTKRQWLDWLKQEADNGQN